MIFNLKEKTARHHLNEVEDHDPPGGAKGVVEEINNKHSHLDVENIHHQPGGRTQTRTHSELPDIVSFIYWQTPLVLLQHTSSLVSPSLKLIYNFLIIVFV